MNLCLLGETELCKGLVINYMEGDGGHSLPRFDTRTELSYIGHFLPQIWGRFLCADWLTALCSQ